MKRLIRSNKSNLLFLNNKQDEDNDINEFSEQELVGVSSTFDCRIGNRYTRKIHIREIFNITFSSDIKINDREGNYNCKYIDHKKTIRSQENKNRNFLY